MATTGIFSSVVKWCALLVSMLASLASGSLMVFTVYQNALKGTYNYTQSEVEILPSMLSVGAGLAFIPGIIFDRFGPKWTSALALVLSSGGYILIWSSGRAVNFYKNKVWLLSLYFLIVGQGCVSTNSCVVFTCVRNFSTKFRGTIIGLLTTCFGLGPTVFSLVYYRIFVSENESDVIQHDYPNFMLTLGIIFAAINFACVILLRLNHPVLHKTEQNAGMIASEIEVTQNEIITSAKFVDTEEGGNRSLALSSSTGVIAEDLISNRQFPRSNSASCLHQLQDVNFLLLCFMFACATSACSATTYNITTNTKSLQIGHLDSYLTIVAPISNVTTALLMGIFSDRVISKIPRIRLILVGNISIVSALIILTFGVDILSLFITALVLYGIGAGIVWSLTPTFLSERFGMTHFGRNWGLFIIAHSAFTFLALVIFGALYDSQIDTPGEHVCYGVACLRSAYGTLLAIGSFSPILGFIFIRRN